MLRRLDGAGGFRIAPVMTFHSIQKKPAYRPDIDGLRAIAVLSVVFYHAEIPGLSGGFVGVDVFFVISGFLITGIVWQEIGYGGFSLRSFYVRRIKRIFPALFVVLAASSIAAFLLLIPGDLAKFGKSVNETVLFSSNFFWRKHTDYFDAPARDNPLLHIWSLSVEEQFYAVWPVVLLLLSRLVSVKRAIYIVAGLALVSLVLSEARLPYYQKDAFYFPWCRAWELLAGALLALSPAALRLGRFATAFAGTGLAAIGLAVAFYDPSTRFPGLTAIIPCGGAALLIAAGITGNPVSRLLSAEPLRRTGLISYSLYLIHWPLFSFAHLYLGHTLPLTLRLSLVLASFALAYGSWRFIETPLRKAKFPELSVFGAAAVSMSCFFLAGILFSQSGGLPSRIDEAVRREILKFGKPEDGLSKYCRQLAISGIKGDTVCEMGEDRGGVYDFILWGDSHARHFVPAIGTLATNRKLSGLLLERNGCHPFLDDSHAAKACRDFNAAVARWVENHPVKLAIVAGRWIIQDKYLKRYVTQKDPSENSGGLAKTLAFLTGKGIAASVIDQVPDFPVEVRSCIGRAIYYQRSLDACVSQPAAFYEARHRVLTDYFAYLKKHYDFTFSSAAGLICGRETCRAKDGDNLLMADSHHLTEAGSLRTIPYLHIPLLTEPAQDEKAKAAIAESGLTAAR